MTRAARARVAAARLAAENADLERRVYIDHLTGVGSRWGYERLVERLEASAADERVTVLLVDVDRFKSVNDTFGHGVGDSVLQRVAAMLLARARPGDLVARLGGDELVMVALGEIEGIAARAAGVVEEIERSPWGELRPGLAVTVSVGWAAGPAREVLAVFDEADRGLYVAKRGGRGQAASAPAA